MDSSDIDFLPFLLGCMAEQDASPHPEAERTGNGPKLLPPSQDS